MTDDSMPSPSEMTSIARAYREEQARRVEEARKTRVQAAVSVMLPDMKAEIRQRALDGHFYAEFRLMPEANSRYRVDEMECAERLREVFSTDRPIGDRFTVNTKPVASGMGSAFSYTQMIVGWEPPQS